MPPFAPVLRSPAEPGARTPPRVTGTTATDPGHRRAPHPIVVARAVAAPATGDRRIPGAHTSAYGQPPAAGRVGPAPAASAPAPRTLALLAARPLGVRTRAPEAAGAASAARPPVVPAAWSREPAPAPDTRRTPAAAPGVPRTPAGPAAPTSPRHSPAPPARAVPVVRPDTPVQRAVAAGRPRALPVSDPQASPLQARPPVPSVPSSSSAPSVPVVRAVRVTSPEPEFAAGTAAVGRTAGPAVPVVQRKAAGGVPAVQRDAPMAGGRPAVPAGVQVGTAPARQPSTAAPPPATGGKAAKDRPAAVQDQAAGIDMEDLARRLLEPMARLLRADLRRGRERTGRPYDGRR